MNFLTAIVYIVNFMHAIPWILFLLGPALLMIALRLSGAIPSLGNGLWPPNNAVPAVPDVHKRVFPPSRIHHEELGLSVQESMARMNERRFKLHEEISKNLLIRDDSPPWCKEEKEE